MNEIELKNAVEYLTPPKDSESKHLRVLLSLARDVLDAKTVKKRDYSIKHGVLPEQTFFNEGWNAAIDAQRLDMAKNYVRRDALPSRDEIEDIIEDFENKNIRISRRAGRAITGGKAMSDIRISLKYVFLIVFHCWHIKYRDYRDYENTYAVIFFLVIPIWIFEI